MNPEQDDEELLFGSLLRLWRKSKGMTLEQLAEELKKCGYDYDYSTLGKYEREERTPTGTFFAHLSLCLELNPKEAEIWIRTIARQNAIRMVLEYRKVIKE